MANKEYRRYYIWKRPVDSEKGIIFGKVKGQVYNDSEAPSDLRDGAPIYDPEQPVNNDPSSPDYNPEYLNGYTLLLPDGEKVDGEPWLLHAVATSTKMAKEIANHVANNVGVDNVKVQLEIDLGSTIDFI